MIFDAGTHFLMGQARFIQAACRGAGQIFRYERVDPEHRKGLLGQQDMAAGTLLYAGQQFKVAGQRRFVHDIDRRAQTGLCVVQILHRVHSTVTGFSSTTQGRPY